MLLYIEVSEPSDVGIMISSMSARLRRSAAIKTGKSHTRQTNTLAVEEKQDDFEKAGAMRYKNERNQGAQMMIKHNF